ncbi:four helix bundle protein [Candidatus Margulisiibacteriota bacterium]
MKAINIYLEMIGNKIAVLFIKEVTMMYQEQSISGDQDISRQGIRKSGYQENRGSGYQEEPVAGFETLWIWQKAHQLMLEVHEICRTLPREERFKRRDQLERSSSSVPDNIAEGHTSYYYQEKIKGMNVARKEAGETQNHIRAIEGKRYITKQKAIELIKRYEEVIRGINGYTRWVREKRKTKR